MPQRIRKGDLVAVISGDDKGRRGRVLRVIPERDRLIVEGVNVVFKHLRRSQKNPQGGRVRREAPIHASNVMPIDPQRNEPTRVGMRSEGDRRVRYGRRSGAAIDSGTPRRGKSARSEAGKGGREERGEG